jgi:hypothetical protein
LYFVQVFMVCYTVNKKVVGVFVRFRAFDGLLLRYHEYTTEE